MTQDTFPGAGADPAPCRYEGSRLWFRGPRRPLDGRHIAFVGAGGTRGGPADPFPALLERETGQVCVNFGLRTPRWRRSFTTPWWAAPAATLP